MTTHATLAAQVIAASDQDGVTRQDIARAAGLTERETTDALRFLRKSGGTHFCGNGQRYRYFATAAWTESFMAPERVEARNREALRRYGKTLYEKRKAERAAVAKNRPPQPVKKSHKSAPRPANVEAIIPDHVQVQRLPGFVARSFAPDAGFVGEFTTAWRAKVGATS